MYPLANVLLSNTALITNPRNRTAYANVAGKYQDVLTLEQSVAELHQMFLDFALLTEQQGELLDQIEYQVRSAADYIEDANVDVHEAIEYQKKIRKKQWCVPWGLLLFVRIGLSTERSFRLSYHSRISPCSSILLFIQFQPNAAGSSSLLSYCSSRCYSRREFFRSSISYIPHFCQTPHFLVLVVCFLLGVKCSLC